MTASIDTPIRARGPSDGLNRLFRHAAFDAYSTASIADGSQEVIEGGVLNGLFLVYVTGSTQSAGLFSITGGDTVTIVADWTSGGNKLGTTFENDGTLNIDITSGDLRINNELGSAGVVSVVFLQEDS